MERFWQKVDKSGPDQCWHWNAGLDTRGYGSFRYKGNIQRAHRVAWELTYGPIPRGDGHHGTVVRHKCDNRRCCNPSHLLLGRHADNMADLKHRGRRKGIATGEGNGRAKLDVSQVAAIRSDTRGQRAVAAEYGISPAQVQRIRRGLQWT